MNETFANAAYLSTETPVPTPVSARLIGNRFRVVRLLKKERAAEHFLAEDVHDGAAVVVACRTSSHLSPGARQRVEYEAQLLGGLNCPELTRVLDFGQDGETFYVVRPYVPGISLRRACLAGLSIFRIRWRWGSLCFRRWPHFTPKAYCTTIFGRPT